MKDSEIIGKHFHFNNDSFDNPIPCGLMNLYPMGELCCERGYVVEPHSQACHEISYIVSGKGFFFVDGERIPVSEGDLIFNNKNCIHAIEADKDSMLRYLYMGFDFRGQAEGQNVQELFDYYNQKNSHFSVKISIPLENTGVSSVFTALDWPFSLIFSLARRNEGNFFQAVPTTLSSSLADVRLASLVAWA